MPRGDGTGPLGQGSRTGRSLGYCSGYNAPGSMIPGPGLGLGRGRGGVPGRGGAFRRGGGLGGGRFNRPYPRFMPGAAPQGAAWGPAGQVGPGGFASPEDELRFLKSQSESLKDSLDGIEERIKAIEGEAE